MAYKQQKFISQSSGGWKSKRRVPAVRYWWNSSKLQILIVSSHARRGKEPLLQRCSSHSWGLRPHDLITSQRPRLLIPWPWGLVFNTWILGRQTFRAQHTTIDFLSSFAGWSSRMSSPSLLLYQFIHLFLNLQSHFIFLKINLFIYFWLRWVFVAARGFSLIVASGAYSSLRCAGFSLRWLLLLRSTGSRLAGFSSCGLRALELSSCGAWA